jgi:hypothetical protein
VRTVKLDDLATSLPPAAPLVDLAGRSAQIAARMADFAQRFIE